jgi:small subunit ribosomal protein S6
MKNYELLFTVPGTLTEEEVIPLAEEVEDLLSKQGVQNIVSQDLGKSRLAYPMKHIRYGYFRMFHFEAEPQVVIKIEKVIRLMPQMLRVNINSVTHQPFKISQITAVSDVLSRPERGSKTVDSEVKERLEKPNRQAQKQSQAIESAEEEVRQVTKTVKVKDDVEKTTQTKVEDVKMEEIDKKLDEFLEGDVSEI